MSANRDRMASLVLTLGLLAVNLVAFNVLLAAWRPLRVDLTEDRRYSISSATRRILDGLDEPVTVRGYFSSRTHPKLAPLVPQIVDLLEEYRAVSGGRVRVEIVDPREDGDAEREASDRFGVQSTPFRLASKYEAGIVNAYFALVIQYGDRYERYGFDDLIEVEALPDGDVDVRLRNLEYDLTRAIKKTAFGFRATADLFEQLDAPVRLTAVITLDSLPEPLAEIPDAVRGAAEELGQQGGERFEYRELDPATDEAAAAEAQQRYGARPMSLGLFADRPFYLYGFLEIGDRAEQLVLTGENVTAASVREAVEDSLRRLTPGFLKTVGVVAPDPSIPPEIMMQLRMQGQMPPQPPPEFDQLKRYLERDYEVRPVELNDPDGVATDVDVLVVLKPRRLAQQAVYALDQYLMRGGRVILCSGRYDVNFDRDGLNVSPAETGLEDWLAHFGLTLRQTLVLDDRNQPLPIPEVRMTALGPMRTWRMEPYPYLVEIRDEGLVDVQVAARLDAMGLYWASPLELDGESAAEAGLETLELLRSSDLSWTDDDTGRVGYVDYEVPAETGSQLLGVALRGRFESYFALERAAEGGAADDAARPGATVPDGVPEGAVPLERSPDTRLVVIGNEAFVSDLVAQALGTGDSGFFAENLAFMQNLIDWANLDDDLIGIRSRVAGSRRLVAVERDREMLLESANYLLPLAALLGLGSWRLWRRRHVAPLVATRATGRTNR